MSTNAMLTPFVIGHRGAAGLAPENTLASMRRAAAEGVRWVEFDVGLSRDGVAVLFHDDTVNRTTNGKGALAGHDLAHLRGLDAGSWFDAVFAGEPVPSFAETMQTLATEGLGANVEIKPTPGMSEATARTVCTMIAETWPATVPPPVISSFDRDAMAVARDMLPDIERAMLFGKLPKDWAAVVARLDCGAVHMSTRYTNQRVADDVLGAGLPLRVYTVNDPKRAEALRAMGVTSVFTDRPDIIKD